ncbi:hypothetical protein COLU111180_04115 [Cohnella lubricantis]|uniref:Uncharacterized protein n=1 Tax=Cohnella lubricantis TaxID=2163172 RepID=A0A841T8X7_9BACL|nr:hypothetical protein [Cohnella lubricantis]MBB6676506.1 hypothetical protein [Cohnella lubricantis]MBP2117126.1 hypothetical protein [Cohnella lubricantis]
MDRQEVADWIADNLLDSDAWDRANEQKQAVAVKQAERNLARWYPAAALDVSLIAYQAVWELQGVDPALKFQRHNVKTITDNGESISYKDGVRDSVAPDVRQLLGATADEIASGEAENGSTPLYGGVLL